MMEVFQEHKRDIIAIAVIFALLCISIGYAALSSNLTINGASQIKDAVWDIHWENIQVTDGSVTAITEPTIDSGRTTVTYEVHFDTPGQVYEFTVDAKNSGTIDGMINTINSNLNGNPISTLPNYFNYFVSYSDGVPVQTKQELNAGTTETYKVRIEYKKDIQVSDLPSTDQDLVLSFTVTYVQKDSSAVVVGHPAEFATDSWDTIVGAVQSGNTDTYHVGDTKEIDMGSLGIHTLRIANMSNPDQCNQEEFSKTACGFVLEFSDIVTARYMHSYAFDNFDWYDSELYAYLEGDFYNLIPSDLRNNIIDTYTLTTRSGGTVTRRNNKLYFLAPFEIMGTQRADYVNSSMTRQLDYYLSIPVTPTSYSGAIKKYNGSNYGWWLRSSYGYGNRQGKSVESNGFIRDNDGTSVFSTTGVSPAFRIG